MISIVVPVYKVEKYLERCVNSLLNQTYQDIEIILVDDGSPDLSPELCDKYAKKDNRIVVIHKENGGLSSARNAGLRVAKGEYVGFVDSDDDVENEMYEKMYRVITKEKVDFVISDYMRISDDGKEVLKTLSIPQGHYSKSDIIEKIFPQLIMGENLEYGPLLSVCPCLYRIDLLRKNSLEFDEKVRWSEDNIFSAFVGYNADSFYYMKNEGLYHYYSNPGTITTGYREGAWKVYCTMNEHLHQFFDEVKDYDFQKQLKLHMIFYACNCLGQLKTSEKNFAEQMKIRKEIMCSEQLKKVFENFKFPQWHWKLKTQIYLMKYKMKYLYAMFIG